MAARHLRRWDLTTVPDEHISGLTGVSHGVFFTSPAPLPRGRHDLNEHEVARAQRERALIAATELLAAVGYRKFGVREICARAGISRTAFYAGFANKDDCIFAAYDRFIAVLVERLTGEADSLGKAWPGRVLGIVAVYLGTLEQDLVVARAFQVEMDALGAGGRQRRRDSLVGLAALLRDVHERLGPATGSAAPMSAFIGVVYAVRQIASDLLDEHQQPDLLALAPELTSWILRAVTESTQEPSIGGA